MNFSQLKKYKEYLHTASTPKLLFLSYLVFSFLLILFSYLFIPQGINQILRSDFLAFYTSGKIVKDLSIDQIYNLDIQKNIQQTIQNRELIGLLSFRSLPIIAILYSPFAVFDYITAYRIFFFVNFLIICSSFFLLTRDLTTKTKIQSLLLVLISPPFYYLIYYAQVATLVTFLITLIYLSYRKNQSFLVGVLLGLLLIKLQFLIIAPILFLLSPKKTRLFLGFIASIIILIGVNTFLYGSDFIPDYFYNLLRTETVLTGTLLENQINILGIIGRIGNLIPVPNLYTFGVVISIILYIISNYLIYRRRGSLDKDILFLLIIISAIFLNIHSMLVDVGYLIPSFVILYQKNNQNKNQRIFVTFALLWPIITLFTGIGLTIMTLTYLGILYKILLGKNAELTL